MWAEKKNVKLLLLGNTRTCWVSLLQAAMWKQIMKLVWLVAPFLENCILRAGYWRKLPKAQLCAMPKFWNYPKLTFNGANKLIWLHFYLPQAALKVFSAEWSTITSFFSVSTIMHRKQWKKMLSSCSFMHKIVGRDKVMHYCKRAANLLQWWFAWWFANCGIKILCYSTKV